MVMHARKTQRMNDGYFEKHQTHPYQNSKYSSSKNSYGGSGERYERLRDSPNGNSYRSDSPDSQSPRDRDRTYQSKSSYLQKMREKERENRDYKVSRDKYSDCARSPKDKRNRDSEHRTNHDRSDDRSHQVSQNLSSRDRKPMHNNCLDKKEDRERVSRVGDWSEHISSSGKKYYYNCKTEVSQWEKPREWMDRERFRNKDRDRDSDRNYSRSGHDKHSNSRASNSKDGSRESATGSRHWSSGSKDESDAPSTQDSRRKHVDGDSQSTQDMDISPGDSTPTSEVSYSHSGGPSQSHQPVEAAVGPILLATALPRLSHMYHPPTTPTITNRPADTSPLTSTPSIVPPPASVTTSNTPGPPTITNMSGLPRNLSQLSVNSADADAKALHNALGRQAVTGESGNQTQQPLHVDTNHNANVAVDGPPTPTHSETPDCPDTRKSIPMSSPPGSLSSLQGVASSLGALRPQGPSITPSLANHYRDDLVNHVRGWPADILEKQAQKLSEEAHIMGSIQCSKVSAELKSARSIVRLTEIQATLQEQRILFLRQQIKMLEELKSQNSFMSDDL